MLRDYFWKQRQFKYVFISMLFEGSETTWLLHIIGTQVMILGTSPSMWRPSYHMVPPRFASFWHQNYRLVIVSSLQKSVNIIFINFPLCITVPSDKIRIEICRNKCQVCCFRKKNFFTIRVKGGSWHQEILGRKSKSIPLLSILKVNKVEAR